MCADGIQTYFLKSVSMLTINLVTGQDPMCGSGSLSSHLQRQSRTSQERRPFVSQLIIQGRFRREKAITIKWISPRGQLTRVKSGSNRVFCAGCSPHGGKLVNSIYSCWMHAHYNAGRRLTQTYVQLKPGFKQRALRVKRDLIEARFKRPLAVHVRLTDKVSEAPDNFGLSYQELYALIQSHMAREGYDGFIFCTDAKDLKEFVVGQCGDSCVTYDSSLSDNGPTHKDREIPNRKKAEDIVMEVLLMASCRGFISTYSNVANGVLFFGSSELARNHEYLLRLKHKLLSHERAVANGDDVHVVS
mmetsp:Transcript_11294/g.15642  ORF Transcript_11294/g.15642 Transcript_11294/m.15642 type:complete len:303 (+) Transcript_11294:70-978(+)